MITLKSIRDRIAKSFSKLFDCVCETDSDDDVKLDPVNPFF